MRRLGPDIAEAQNCIADDLALESQAPVLRIRSDEFLIQDDHEKRRGKGNVVIRRADREDVLLFAPLKWPVEGAVMILHVIAERRDVVGVVLRVERGRVKKDGVAAANA